MAALLLVAVLAVGVTVLGGSDGPPPEVELDEAAVRACELFEPVAAGVRSGELTGQPLFRALQDVFNEARVSESQAFASQVGQLNSAAINNNEQMLRQGVIELQLTCQTRRG